MSGLAAAARQGAAGYVKLLRLQYWAKNLLIFVPGFLGNALGSASQWRDCAMGFLLFSLAASATYIVNDLIDVEADRRHAVKRSRPLATGTVAAQGATLLAAGLLASALAGAALWKPAFVPVLLGYTGASLVYTLVLKRVPVADVVWLAGLHTSRLVAGVIAAGVMLSPWLIAFALVFFFSLSIAKRYCELVHAGGAGLPGRGYGKRHGPMLFLLGAAAALASLVVLALYILDSSQSALFYAHPQALWASVAVIAAWLLHVWRAARSGALSEDPVNFALRDRTSLLLLAGLLVAMWTAK